MDTKQPYDIVLNDELQWSSVPKISADDDEIAAAETYARRFLDKWSEKGGVPPRGSYKAREEEEEDDDIGATFVTTDRQLANANRDIGRLVDNARIVVSKLPNPPDMVTGHKMVLLDRARRVALGEARPAPMSLTQGLDGGVNRTPFRHRRPRPEDYERDEERDKTALTKKGGRRADMLPRRRADTGTACAGVQPNRFTVDDRHRTTRPGLRVIKRRSDITGSVALQRNRTHHVQKVLAGYLLRQPAVAATRAAVRYL
ncbi:phosphoglycerate mutase family protein [Ophiostoma piceae UAMH 11346]|uniref:Phosphoglycerate mutase family protein n=1 Tax=Ophiostoma piceae (strain UAMH 11346) TaxID=1262450 RepID=S3C235_OPHP1|nr:phosphoglycerate mutase family protein [Ophiostoma piceae UAMH 11346]